MNITWHGQNTFVIHDKDTRIITDLFNEGQGFKLPKIHDGDLVFLNKKLADYSEETQQKMSKADIFIIDGAGEYSYHNVTAKVFRLTNDNSQKVHALSFSFRGILFVSLLDLDRELTNQEIAQLGSCDILMIPVGGHDVLNYKKATVIINKIEPRVVIPMNYRVGEMSLERDDLELFKKEMGVNQAEELLSYSIKKSELPIDTQEVKVLTIKV